MQHDRHELRSVAARLQCRVTPVIAEFTVVDVSAADSVLFAASDLPPAAVTATNFTLPPLINDAGLLAGPRSFSATVTALLRVDFFCASESVDWPLSSEDVPNGRCHKSGIASSLPVKV